jgi:hypothetical protein
MHEVAMAGGDDTEHRTDQRAEASRRIVAAFKEAARREGWEWGMEPYEHQLRDYGLGDWANQFFLARDFKHNPIGSREKDHRFLDPLFFGVTSHYWRSLDPNHIGIVAIPKSSLNNGALLTDFDRDNPVGLQEVRSYGDVALPAVPVAKAAGRDTGRMLAEDFRMQEVTKKVLSTEERKKIPKSDFCIPEKAPGPGSYPIPDEGHAQNALARVAQHGTPEEQARVRRAVSRKYPNLSKSWRLADLPKVI